MPYYYYLYLKKKLKKFRSFEATSDFKRSLRYNTRVNYLSLYVEEIAADAGYGSLALVPRFYVKIISTKKYNFNGTDTHAG